MFNEAQNLIEAALIHWRIKIIKSPILTGFHRSATSALVNWLYDAGLSMGSCLIPGHIFNTKGYLEDLGCVHIHDNALRRAGTNWQFHDDVEMPGAALNERFLEQYIVHRNELSASWCVKDPRIVLLLEQWAEVLQENGHFFILRYWSGCVKFLLNRHSREVAYQVGSRLEQYGLGFWQQPSLAARLWLSYNKRFMSFIAKFPARCTVITQRGLVQNQDVLSLLSYRTQINLQEATPSPFEASLFQDQASTSVRDILINNLVTELYELWAQLLTKCDVRSDSETPNYVAPVAPSAVFLKNLRQCQGAFLVSSAALPSAKPERRVEITLDSFLAIEKLAELSSYFNQHGDVFKQFDEHDLGGFVQQVINKFYCHFNVLAVLGAVLKRANFFELAIKSYEHAIVIKPEHAASYVQLADFFDLLIKVDLARFVYEKALSKQLNNAFFHIALAKFKQKYSGLAAVMSNFEKAYLLDADNKNTLLAYCNALYEAGDIQSALNLINDSGVDKDDPNVIRMRQQLLLKQDPAFDRLTDIELIRDHLNHESRFGELTINFQLVDLAIA
ncbi:hypothetical protein [Alishewanella tabrizica]|uniref:hypothetical protein n=1 Tax=Alishewanella tabrizica TaxID=671278 RepID=UPI001E4B26A1|nr:hypothetical protein [Alishewanella tabrizica]